MPEVSIIGVDLAKTVFHLHSLVVTMCQKPSLIKSP